MTRLIIRFKGDGQLNIAVDCFDLRDEWIMAWRGEDLVVIARAEDVNVCYIFEEKE
jgi:hypothetical protein